MKAPPRGVFSSTRVRLMTPWSGVMFGFATATGVRGDAMTRQARDVGILFADISGSMRLYEALGNRDALAAIETCLGVIRNVVAQNNGTVVKTIGDEIMACFADPTDTWLAALAAQGKIEALPALAADGGPIKLGLRVGFDFGPAIENHGDYFGNTVNLAARMVQVAKRGQIITTGEGLGRLPSNHAFLTRGLDWLPVKGKPNGVQVLEVLWKESGPGANSTVIGLASFPAPRSASSELVLRLGFQEWRFDASTPSLVLGRDPTNTVVIANSSASRSHATIERRRDRWVLIDHSSNGTFVAANGTELHIRHEELILGPEGELGLGHPVTRDPAGCLRFQLTRPGN